MTDNTITPLQMYQNDVLLGHIIYDPQQADVIEKLEQLHHHLKKISQATLLTKLKNSLKTHSDRQLGFYLWGPVGVGKTYLMDIFFKTLPFPLKRRVHFHQFMLEIHQQLTQLQGIADPLKQIAKSLAKQLHVLCLDEFIVEDIGDAMLLAGLLQALSQQGIYLIITSNTKPDDLYRHGLQRSRFLPAISHLKQHFETVHLNGIVDHRLQTIKRHGIYFAPLNSDSQQALENYFQQFSRHENIHTDAIVISQRLIPIVKRSHNIIWFDFNILCHVPRSQVDYVEIAADYHLVILSNVPMLNDDRLSQVSYFIKLIDVFYDKRVKLIISAEVAVDELYVKGKLINDFQRTRSRLIEMQSVSY